MRMTAKFLICRSPYASMAGSSVGPSQPQFQLKVFVDTVAVALAVGVVVLLVVANQIVECEPVVASNEIDTINGKRAAGLVYVGAAG